MESKNKVGAVIIMHPAQNNYGTSLQGYATVRKLQDWGYDYDIVRYVKKKSLIFFLKTFIGYLRSGGIKQYLYLRQKKKDLKDHKEYRETRNIRSSAVKRFKDFYFEKKSRFFYGYKALKDGSKDYGVIFVGSDQVWGPLSLYRGFYNLLFVDSSVPTFSYASSFGVSEIFPWQKKGVTTFLNRLDVIGVREQRGAEIVKELTGRAANVVCDPTFLLTKNDWESCMQEWYEYTGEMKDYHLEEPYILTYILGEREDVREQVKLLSQTMNIKIVNLPHIDNYHSMDDNLGDINLFDVDPFDFIRLVKGAEYIVTDSFHGSVFSIIMQKRFISFYRKQVTEKGNTNSRIDSLFSLLGITDRLYSGDICKQMTKPIDYNFVNVKLDELRTNSIAFLKKGLQMSKKN